MGVSVTVDGIPDECWGSIFRLLSPVERNMCSLVCRRWLKIEGRSRRRLHLIPPDSISLSSIFSRFDSLTQLLLNCLLLTTISYQPLILIAEQCTNLTRLDIRACMNITYTGMMLLAKNCKGLRRFSSASCTFGSKAIDALIHHSLALEELYVNEFRGTADAIAASSSLKVISLKNTDIFYPSFRAKHLTFLKVVQCSGNWDRVIHLLAAQDTRLVELHLDMIGISDFGLRAVSKCSKLEVLHLTRTPNCSDEGVAAVAEGRNKGLRKLRIGWAPHRIGNKGLTAVAKCCGNLRHLVLIDINPNRACMEMLGWNCEGMEHLGLWGSDTVGDSEMCCIAAKCVALKELHVQGCPVSDRGIEAITAMSPNLERLKVFNCRDVTDRNQHITYGQRSLYVTCIC